MAITITTVGENCLLLSTKKLCLDHVSKKMWTGLLSSLYGTFVSNVVCVGIWTWLGLDKNHLLSLHRAVATLRLELRLNRRPQPGSGSGSWLSPEPEPGCLPELSTPEPESVPAALPPPGICHPRQHQPDDISWHFMNVFSFEIFLVKQI